MGWSGGTEIFDCVVSSIISDTNINCPITERFYRRILEPLVIVLDKQDWDTQNESTYWTHPIIGKILGNTFEEGI